MIELIITDLDKTLLNDRKEVTDYTSEVLNKCRDKGIKIAYATARPERATRGFQQSFQPDYIISDNGASIYYKGNAIYNNFIPLATSIELISALTEINDITYLTAETGTCLYTNYIGESWDNENWNLVYNDFSKPLNIKILKMSVECKKIELLNNLIADYPNLHLYANSGEDWSQIMHIDSAKMKAIQYISKTFDIKIPNIVAFGDDFNDIEMIQQCGKGIAVGNAIKSVKCAADFICSGNNDDGVAKWIETNLFS